MNESLEFLDTALHQTVRCNAIFPCTSAKKPACRHWQGRFDTPERLAKYPYIGISAPDDIIIFDVDTDTGITTADIDAALGVEIDWDAAFLQSTPSGGAHYAFKAAASVLEAIPNKSSALGLHGFDLRLPRRGFIYTGKGYKTAPIYPNLRWTLENANFPRLPVQAIRRLTPKQDTAPVERVETPEGFTPSCTIPAFTIPTAPGTRNAHILPLARWYKGRNPNATHQDLSEVIAAWHKRSLSAIRTKDMQTSLGEFKAAYRLCVKPMVASFESLIDGYESEYIPRRLAKRCNTAETTAAKIAIKLQRFHGDNALFLGCRKLAEVLECSHVYAARVLKSLVDKGILALSKIGQYGPKLAREASEYFCTIPFKNPKVAEILPCVNQHGDQGHENVQTSQRNAGPEVETGANRQAGAETEGRAGQKEAETPCAVALRLRGAGSY